MEGASFISAYLHVIAYAISHFGHMKIYFLIAQISLVSWVGDLCEKYTPFIALTILLIWLYINMQRELAIFGR